MVTSNVTRFNSLQPAAPHSFTILPDEAQRGSLEFQSYAELVARQLESYGWQPVAPVAGTPPADTVVQIHWGVGEPRTVTWQSPSSVYGGMGWGGSPWYGGGGFYDPFPYWETQSQTYFKRWVAVDVVEGAPWRRGERIKLFEGRAVNESTHTEIAPVMPALVKALFTNFPGANGSTVEVKVPKGQ
jgi:hypothetical protein